MSVLSNDVSGVGAGETVGNFGGVGAYVGEGVEGIGIGAGVGLILRLGKHPLYPYPSLQRHVRPSQQPLLLKVSSQPPQRPTHSLFWGGPF